MKKLNISKGIMISGVLYCSTLLFEVLMQILGLGSADINSIVLTIYLITLALRPISLMALIIFACKALSIILKACSILINEKQ